ncbi:MAG: DUF134 domain-containing protein [Actinomycetota bacterium]|nr:DUF134 domain-containing protein [Actinomycetota bacterium]
MSPRHKKARVCGCPFTGKGFKPTGIPMTQLEKIVLLRDELETLKLCDMDGLTQEEAGVKMGVSRGTVQRILSSARKKVAQAISECKAILLENTSCQ